MLEHAVLVDAGFVGKGVGTDNGLVRLYRVAGDGGYQFGCRHDLGGLDAGLETEYVSTGLDCHHHFFQRSVAGAFAQAVDGALDLAGAALHGGKAVGHGHAKVVVTVGRPDHLVAAGYTGDQGAHVFLPHGRNAVTDSVGHVDGGGTSLDYGVEDTHKEVHVRADCIFGGKFNVVGVFAGDPDRLDGGFDHLVRRHPQLLLHVDRAGGDEGVDTAAGSRPDRFTSGTHVVFIGAGQAADR